MIEACVADKGWFKRWRSTRDVAHRPVEPNVKASASPATSVVTRFKRGAQIDSEVFDYLRLVPECIEGFDQRMRAAELALSEARRVLPESGQTPEGAARAFLQRLAETVGSGGGFGVSKEDADDKQRDPGY